MQGKGKWFLFGFGKGKLMEQSNCDTCVYNVYDEEDEQYYCEVDMDEDDAARLMQGQMRGCPYYQVDDEYAVVRHQM